MGWFSKPKEHIDTTEGPVGATASVSLAGYTSKTSRHLKDGFNHIFNTPGNTVEASNGVFLTSDLIHKCVDYIAKQVSQVEFVPKEYNKESKLIPNPKPRVQELFTYAPNEIQTWPELLRITALSLELTGNAYIVVDKNNGRLEFTAVAEPQKMQVVVANDGSLDSYLFNQTVPFSVGEVIHIKKGQLGNSYYGVSPLITLKDQLEIEAYGTKDTKKFYQNGMVSTSILTSEHPLTKKQAEELTTTLGSKYNMENQRHSLLVLPNNLSAKPLRISPKDALVFESMDIAEDRIFGAYNLHKMLVGGAIESYTHNLGQLMNVQFANAIRPVVTLIKTAIETHVHRYNIGNAGKTFRLEIDYTNLPEVQLARLAHAETSRLLYVSGLTSLNESREILGLERIEDTELADQNHLPSFLIGSDLNTIQNLTEEDIKHIQELNREAGGASVASGDAEGKQTDVLGGANNGKDDKNDA